MSDNAHQMERSYSIRSLSNRGGSEMTSSYMVESGFFVSSFAATMFIGALATVGILLISLLVVLAVMLQSCESKNSGVVQSQKLIYYHRICNIYAQHAELSGLKEHDCPPFCGVLAKQYIKGGLYARELNVTNAVIQNYLGAVTAVDGGLDVVLMDADDISSLHPLNVDLVTNRFENFDSESFEEANHLKQSYLLQLYTELQARGWTLVFFSRKSQREQNVAREIIYSAGFRSWYSLIMRSDDELQIDSRTYFSRRREALEKDGFRIAGVISSHIDALTGPFSGKLILKIPNPICYKYSSAH